MGRSHAALLAEEGADIVAVDICQQIESVNYPMATPADLEETADIVRALGRKVVPVIADVRNLDEMRAAVEAGVDSLGGINIVLANAGVMTHQLSPYPNSSVAWQDSLDVLLTGVWNTLQATVPTMIRADRGGSVVITSSSVGLKLTATNFDGGFDGYGAAKHGVVGLMRAYAGALAKHSIRVNSIHPTGVDTPMVMNKFFGQWMNAEPELAAIFTNALPVAGVEMIDVSRAVLYLVSDDGRFVTGQTLAIDAGQTTVANGSGTRAVDLIAAG